MAKEIVTLNYEGHYGYVEFDGDSKNLTVHIPEHSEMETKVREFLTTPQTMDIPKVDNIREFQTVTLTATDSIDVFKIVLTRLWVNTQVLVEWSMPPRATEKL